MIRLRQDFVHIGGIRLFRTILNGRHANTENPLSEPDLDHVPDPNVVGSFRRPTVDRNVGSVASVVRHGTPFDDARDFQVFVKPH